MLPKARIPALPNEAAHLTPLVQLSETVTGQPLCEGNTIEPLWDGDQAFPAMLQAIEDAKHSVGLSMYIFNNDRTGNRFAAALETPGRHHRLTYVEADPLGECCGNDRDPPEMPRFRVGEQP